MFLITSIVTSAGNDGVYLFGFTLLIGWGIALLMTIHAIKRKSKLWFFIVLTAGWALPIINIYIFGYLQDYFPQR